MIKRKLPLSCYGKLPFYKEYLRHNLHSPETEKLIEWIEEGMRLQSSENIEAGNFLYRFIFLPKEQKRFICGIIQNSSDGLRTYPFTVFVSCPKNQFRSHPIVLAIIFDSFWLKMEDFLRADHKTIDNFTNELMDINMVSPSMLSINQKKLQKSFLSFDLIEYLESMFSSQEQEKKGRLLENLLYLYLAYRKRPNDAKQGAFRLPLADSSILSLEAQTSFWVGFLGLILQRKHEFSSIFLPGHDNLGNQALRDLYIFFREPAPMDFVEIMLDKKNSKRINNFSEKWDTSFLKSFSSNDSTLEAILNESSF